MKIMTKTHMAILFLAAATLTGCMRTSSRHHVKDYYILDTERNKPAMEQKFDTSLIVENFEVAEGFNSNLLVYRNKEGKIEADHYRRFITDKGVMLSNLTSQWLSDSGLFKVSATAASGINSRLRLKAMIQKMYADMQKDTDLATRLEIKVFLLSYPKREAIFWKQYSVSAEVENKTAEAVIEATNQNVFDFLTLLENDLSSIDLSGYE
jgi:cholesterol transport system auxiliary component